MQATCDGPGPTLACSAAFRLTAYCAQLRLVPRDCFFVFRLKFRGDSFDAMPAPTMVESEEEESKWDWWPTLASSGVQVTVPQATATGFLLAKRAAKYLETGAPSLKKRDCASVQDNRTLRDVCEDG
eukprot:2591456-Amphidinium_carterae.1